MQIVSKNISETKKFAKEFLKSLETHAPPVTGGAQVVGLYGNLGSGKTAFVQCVAEELGVTDHITSPTFVIMKRFKIQESPVAEQSSLRGTARFKNLVHIDAYRLKNGDELRKLRFDGSLQDGGNLILIEWADLVADILPMDHIKLYFEFVDDQTRRITSE